MKPKISVSGPLKIRLLDFIDMFSYQVSLKELLGIYMDSFTVLCGRLKLLQTVHEDNFCIRIKGCLKNPYSTFKKACKMLTDTTDVL